MRIYDYIVRRNYIVNQMKIICLKIHEEKDLLKQLELIQNVCSYFNTEFDFLMKHQFEPNKRFIQLIHDKSIEFIHLLQTYNLDNKLCKILYIIHDKTHF